MSADRIFSKIRINYMGQLMPDIFTDDAIVPIYKPPGPTSFTVINRIRRATGVKKVGHAGTLDPFAEGVLVVGIGRKATRKLLEFVKSDKEYVGTVRLGVTTDSYDRTGKVLNTQAIPGLTREEIDFVLTEFIGEIEQTPPPFSAVKVGGVRLYKAARRGMPIEANPRRITIYSLNLMEVTPFGFTMRVCCSPGTYIRTLAYDIGQRLNVGGHLEMLIRTRVGNFTLESAIPLVQFIDNPSTCLDRAIWI